LFLNAAAHIQHHYMFSSAAYDGPLRNPAWYIKDGVDPLFDVYKAYDLILGDVRRQFPEARIMIATGLHQNPHPKLTFYWRLKAHADFLRMIGAQFVSVEPLMSRDFLVKCESKDSAARLELILTTAMAKDGNPLFEIDNRGSDLFVMLTYSADIGVSTTFTANGTQFDNLRQHVAFVAIKNGEHDGLGYFVDSGAVVRGAADCFPLKNMPDRILGAFAIADIAAKREPDLSPHEITA
jgi:hypothetical protein